MDEPTNDLDVETLELLEDLLSQYRGTLLLVSHDRAFLNNVVAGTFVFEGKGKVVEYPGGYDDWLNQRPRQPKRNHRRPSRFRRRCRKNRKHPNRKNWDTWKNGNSKPCPKKSMPLKKSRKCFYNLASDPLVLSKRKNGKKLRIQTRLDEVAQEIEKAYLRWEVLDRINQGEAT